MRVQGQQICPQPAFGWSASDSVSSIGSEIQTEQDSRWPARKRIFPQESQTWSSEINHTFLNRPVSIFSSSDLRRIRPQRPARAKTHGSFPSDRNPGVRACAGVTEPCVSGGCAAVDSWCTFQDLSRQWFVLGWRIHRFAMYAISKTAHVVPLGGVRRPDLYALFLLWTLHQRDST